MGITLVSLFLSLLAFLFSQEALKKIVSLQPITVTDVMTILISLILFIAAIVVALLGKRKV